MASDFWKNMLQPLKKHRAKTGAQQLLGLSAVAKKQMRI